MIVDTSVIIAVLFGEPGSTELMEFMLQSKERLWMSAGTYLEAGIVIDRLGNALTSVRLDQFLIEMRISILPTTESQVQIGRSIYRGFGKGSGHPAQLNFGDCFALALSLEMGEPLLYKGDDFARAGIANALPSP